MAYNAENAREFRRGGFDNRLVRVLAGEAGTLTNSQKYKAWVHAGVPPKEAYALANGHTQLAAPGAPTVTPTGTAGTTSYFYKIVARDASGTSVAGAEGSTTTGNATLSAGNYNALSWTAVTNAASYDVYRGTATGAENTLVTSAVVGTTYHDQGGGSAATPPATNTSGVPTLNAKRRALYHAGFNTKDAARLVSGGAL